MTAAAADHARIGFNRHDRHLNSPINVDVGLVDPGIVGVQVSAVAVKAIGVLHQELAHAHQAAARAWLVAHFGLDLIEDVGQLTIGANVAPAQIGHDLFMSHGEHEVAPVAILGAPERLVDLLPAAGLLPELGRHDDRQVDFLTIHPIHLVAQDGRDLFHDAPAER